MVTVLLLIGMLVFALTLLILALWQNDIFFGIASAILFLITGLFMLTDGVDNFPSLFLTPTALVFILFGIGVSLIYAVGDW